MTEPRAISKLDVDNYASWSCELKYLMIDKGLWGAIDPDFAEPSTIKGAALIDKRAKAVIGLCVQPHHHDTVESAKTAKELWETLESIYKPRGNAQQLRLRKAPASLEQIGSEPITKYICRAKTTWHNLEACGGKATESEVVLSILAGLDRRYTTISSIISSRDKPGKASETRGSWRDVNSSRPVRSSRRRIEIWPRQKRQLPS